MALNSVDWTKYTPAPQRAEKLVLENLVTDILHLAKRTPGVGKYKFQKASSSEVSIDI